MEKDFDLIIEPLTVLPSESEMLDVGTQIVHESKGELRFGTITQQGYKKYGVQWDDGGWGMVLMTDVSPL